MKKTLLILSLILTSCGKPSLKNFHQWIKSSGYIPYTTPLEFSGVGTILGHDPKRMMVMAHHHSCITEDVYSRLRKIDATTMAQLRYQVRAEGALVGDLIKILNQGNPLFKMGAQFRKIKTVELEFHGASIEYLDWAKFFEQALPQLSSHCQRLMEDYPMITQALRVEQLSFSFHDHSGAIIDLSAGKIHQLLDLEVKTDFQVERKTILKINTPKYIDMQVTKLKNILSGQPQIWMANQIRNKKFWFKR